MTRYFCLVRAARHRTMRQKTMGDTQWLGTRLRNIGSVLEHARLVSTWGAFPSFSLCLAPLHSDFHITCCFCSSGIS